MDVTFILGENPYNCCTVFSKSLALALEKLGWRVEFLFLSKNKEFHELEKLFSSPPDFTLSFLDIHFDNRSFGELWSTPHISLLLDPVFYSLHQCLAKNCFVTVVDQKELSFLENKEKKSLFFPHAVDRNYASEPHEKKEIELLFFGTLIDPQEIENRWETLFSSSQVKELKTLCEEYFSSTFSLLELLQEWKIPYDLWPKYHFEIDHYTRMKERSELLKECKDLPLSIFGRGPFKKFCPNAQLFPSCTFPEAMQLMKKAKAILNTSIRFKYGAHERIFFAMGAKAVTITGTYPYMQSQFQEEKEFIGFLPNRLKGTAERIRDILESTEKREQIAEKAWDKIIKRDTFDHRAANLKDFCCSLLK